ncbi:MAG: MBL fold metallo-hydrolase, partial [Acidobacteria bacterium]|nr:MBL fold metallo-hydrolase [Acidobacteriota bacterium]
AASSLDSFERTLQMTRELVADHYVTFHHKGVVDGHDAFVAAVDAYAESFRRREDALLALLHQPRSFDELVAEGIVYRTGTRPAVFGESVERRTIQQHLDRLLENGAVEVTAEQYCRR